MKAGHTRGLFKVLSKSWIVLSAGAGTLEIVMLCLCQGVCARARVCVYAQAQLGACAGFNNVSMLL